MSVPHTHLGRLDVCPLCAIPEAKNTWRGEKLGAMLSEIDEIISGKLAYEEMWAWHEAIAAVIHARAGDEDPHRFGRETTSCDWLADQIIEATGGHRRLAKP